MINQIEVLNTTIGDLDLIFSLFDSSVAYQEKKGYPVWRNYDKRTLINDIENGNQYKIVAGIETLIVFSVGYVDRNLWREMDRGDAIYLHRIVVNPEFKGQKLFAKILDWAKVHAKGKGIRKIRMDTWADDPTIINYYKTFGFVFIEDYTTPDIEELPVHNRNLVLTLLEYEF